MLVDVFLLQTSFTIAGVGACILKMHTGEVQKIKTTKEKLL
jgi:hypothetical protein